MAFDAISQALSSDDAERKAAIKQGNAVFAFTLKNGAGETESWHIDLKNSGKVGKGTGEKANGMSHYHHHTRSPFCDVFSTIAQCHLGEYTEANPN